MNYIKINLDLFELKMMFYLDHIKLPKDIFCSITWWLLLNIWVNLKLLEILNFSTFVRLMNESSPFIYFLN